MLARGAGNINDDPALGAGKANDDPVGAGTANDDPAIGAGKANEDPATEEEDEKGGGGNKESIEDTGTVGDLENELKEATDVLNVLLIVSAESEDRDQSLELVWKVAGVEGVLTEEELKTSGLGASWAAEGAADAELVDAEGKQRRIHKS